ncbi:Kinesin light chain 1 (KLC 1) [Durusdinium trenchii]|uniref:Kinesin light chain 1 (KLC 1) n=1 Tax=Durusdinium trenchii TaxID=1381693 RepID=A0ABP0KA01_9DINO
MISVWHRLCRGCCCRRHNAATQTTAVPFADHVDHGKALVATTTAPTSDALSRSECRELIEAQPKEECLDKSMSTCRICLEPADVEDYQVCACRGSQGFAHLQCLADLASSKWPSLEPWRQCPTCKQNYVDHVHLALSRALWEVVQDKNGDVQRAAAAQLGLALFANSQFAEAAEIHRKTLASSLEALGWEHADTLASANNLAMALRAEGKASEAELLYTEAMEVMKRVFGPEDPDTLATAANLGLALLEQEKWAEATRFLEISLEGARRVLGRESPRTLTMAANLAMALEAQSRFPEAITLHRDRLEVLRQVYGRCHEESLMATEEMCRALCAESGPTDVAVQLQKRALREVRADLGQDHPYAMAFQKSLAHTLMDMGWAEEAALVLRKTLATERSTGAEELQVITTEAALGTALRMKGDLEEAIAILSKSQKAMCETLGSSHPQVLHNLGSLGLGYAAQGKTKKAKELHGELLSQLQLLPPKQLKGMYSEAAKLEAQLQDQIPTFKMRLRRCCANRCSWRWIPRISDLFRTKQHES